VIVFKLIYKLLVLTRVVLVGISLPCHNTKHLSYPEVCLANSSFHICWWSQHP